MTQAKSSNEAQRHHFVPKLVLRPWLTKQPSGEVALSGYFWDSRHQRLKCKVRGLDSFCCQIGLLSLRHHKLGRDAIERVFFSEIDNSGAIARQVLLNDGPTKMSIDQRIDFARLLLSLEARRPNIIERLRVDAAQTMVDGLDSDDEIARAMAKLGISEKPSELYERRTKVSFEDRALAIVQKLTDNPRVGGKLINGHWMIKKLGEYDGSFVLSDRPLIRLRGFDHPGAAWALPLTPKDAFVAVNHSANMQRVLDASPQRFCKLLNASSANQAERFVFSVNSSDEGWLRRRLAIQPPSTP